MIVRDLHLKIAFYVQIAGNQGEAVKNGITRFCISSTEKVGNE